MLKLSLSDRPHLAWLGLAMLVVGLGYALQRHAGEIGFQAGARLISSEVLYLDSSHGFPRAIVDPLGRTVKLHQPPSAIVSATLVADEMLSRLVDLSRIRSVTYLANDAGISNVPNAYPQSIDRNHGEVEETIAAEPDLLIVSPYSDATNVEMLLNIGIPIIRFADFHSYRDIRRNLRTLARALGAERDAETWISEMDQRIAAVQQRVSDQAKPRVLYYSLSGYSFGPGSLMDETIQLAGGRNVIAELGLEGYTRISPETVIALQPDVILLSGWSAGNGMSAKDILLADSTWRDVPAVINQRVYSLCGAWITSSSPFRVKGIEEVARVLHPARFDKAPATEDSS